MFQITDVRIATNTDNRGKLRAFATVTLDKVFVIRDIKIIDGKRGLFVAMPSIHVTGKCPNCGRKNPLFSNYCSNCGKQLATDSTPQEPRKEIYRDIAHPICPRCREYMESTIISAYRSKTTAPGIKTTA